MITSKRINIIVAVSLAIAILITGVGFVVYEGVKPSVYASVTEYAEKLFSDGNIITVDISVDEDDWQDMLDNAINEEYIMCDVTVNGELFQEVGIRPKGNTSLSSIVNSDSDRYSFKIEFDHYVSKQTCWGLDKLVLNNVYQDNTYLKEYISYDLFEYMGVASPLCSFAKITVNGENWGFYVAIEAVEESFSLRNFGYDDVQLYKPDSEGRAFGTENQQDMAEKFNEMADGFNTEGGNTPLESSSEDETGVSDGGRGNIRPPISNGDQDSSNSLNGNSENDNSGQGEEMTPPNGGQMPDGMTPPNGDQMPEGITPPDGFNSANDSQESLPNTNSIPQDDQFEGNSDRLSDFEKMDPPDMTNGGFGGGMFGGNGTSLVYTDDDEDSYSAIFDTSVFDSDTSDHNRVIKALKNLNEGTDLEKYVDVDSALRYIAVNAVLGNFDSYFGTMEHNYYLYECDGQITMLPWDYNLAFGGFQSGSSSSVINLPIDTPVMSADMEERPFISKLLEVDEYLNTYHGYLQQIVDEYFNSGRYEQTINEAYNLIKDYVAEDENGFCTYEEFETGVEALKLYGKLRCESIEGQLEGTIPSTREEQEQDSSALIDASSLNISDMGSMMGGGDFGGDKRQNMPDFEDMENFDPGRFEGGFGGGSMTAPENTEDTPPDRSGNGRGTLQASASIDKNSIILLAVCGVVLVGGLIFAVFVKRRR